MTGGAGVGEQRPAVERRRRPLVKICGVTRVADAVRAAELGADLLGLNFHPPSPRFLAADAARRLADAVRGRARLVGVFVDRTPAEIERLVDEVGLDLVQLHGDESPAGFERLAARTIKVFRLGGATDPEPLDAGAGAAPEAPVEAWSDAWGVLFEARHVTLYGGTGTSWTYERIAGLAPGRRVLVAGGVGPANVCEALRRSGASGVDVCSGVERTPGIKDPELLERLFAELRTCYGSAR